MVGGRTLLSEDPRLTVKSRQLRQQRVMENCPENPAKVGIISNASLKLDGNFLREGSSRVILFTTNQTPDSQIENLRQAGASVVLAGTERINLHQAMRQLKSEGIEQVLLEGGGTLNAAMFAAGLIDEVRLYIAPLIFGGASAPTLADGIGLSRDEAIQLDLQRAQVLPDGGVLLTYYLKSKRETYAPLLIEQNNPN